MKKPIIYSNGPIFAQGDYDVFVGALGEDKLPMYVVINRTTDVTEFTSEVTLGYLSWLDSIAQAAEQRAQTHAAPKEQIPLSLALKN